MNITVVKCDYCSKEFNKKSYYKKHLKNVHKKDEKGENIASMNITIIKFTCNLCDKHFSRKSNLKRHIETVHICSYDETKCYECSQCSFKTVYRKSLSRHVLLVHEKKDKNRKTNDAENVFICSQCSAMYNRLSNLMTHERKAHQIERSLKNNRKCPVCSFRSNAISKNDMYSHFENVHDIVMKWESQCFDSVDDFKAWKEEIERETKTSYIKRISKKKLLVYECHRNGIYKNTSCGKRLRKIGSCKLNAFCPAIIKVKLQENGSINVLFLSTHVGHENDLRYLKRLKLNHKNVKQLTLQYDEDVLERSIFEEVTRENEVDIDLESQKAGLLQEVREFQLYLKDNLTTSEQVDYIREQIILMTTTIEAIKSSTRNLT